MNYNGIKVVNIGLEEKFILDTKGIRIEKMTLDEMNEHMLHKLQKHNKNNPDSIITRLYFNFDGNQENVNDYSYFANEYYMSDDLRKALSNGQTLTRRLKDELNLFVIEKVYNHDNHEIESENKFMDTFINMHETIKNLEKEVCELKNEKQREQDTYTININIDRLERKN